ncbi:MAG: P1 family peptidase [Gemmatimonadota bacterium]
MLRSARRAPVLAAPVLAALALVLAAAASPAAAQEGPATGAVRARDLGVAIAGEPGRWNAITDVPGVEVGLVTLVEGDGPLIEGSGPVRTGVTAILPRGKDDMGPVFAGHFSLNGNGEMTGTVWLEETGELVGPVTITSTSTVGVVRDAVYGWVAARVPEVPFTLPVTAETLDFPLNDVNGQHVTKAHALEALNGARGGPVAEGNVGGGTGMICHWFKGGTGTASRVLRPEQGGYAVGVLVQCNYGRRSRLRIDGVPVGEAIADLTPCRSLPAEEVSPMIARVPACEGTPDRSGDRGAAAPAETDLEETAPAEAGPGAASWLAALEEALAGTPLDPGAGSIIVVVATDAPLLPSQLRRVAKRVSLGVGRMGGLGENSSGDIFLAFSTAPVQADDLGLWHLTAVESDRMNPIFEAVVQATEEAIVNALVAAETMTGADGFRVHELPHDRLRRMMNTTERK